ncbi:MAG: exodeoxyribonuclease III [Desulfuromonas sp.]|nr:MAG: exodeoxyribonuclease III [Desulfuromonas sp.]
MRTFKVVSFNVNGVRARLHQLKELIVKHAPQVIALQETKVQDHDFPSEEFAKLGYRAVWSGQKTHYGVALLHRIDPEQVQIGFEDDASEVQKRLVGATYPLTTGQKLNVINGYFPQGENREHPVKYPHKRQFYSKLLGMIAKRHDPDDLLLVTGDMNVAPTDLDIGIGENNRSRWLSSGKCSFLPEEGEWLQNIMAWGLVDTFRELNPEQHRYSWFDYRSRGFESQPQRGLRIDLILASLPLMALCQSTGIDLDIRAMERPSDHAPVWAEFNLDR